MRRSFVVTGMVLLVGAAVAWLGACTARPGGNPRPAAAGVDCASPAPATFTAAPSDAAFYDRQRQLISGAARVQAVADRFPDVVAGVGVDNEHARVVVYRKPSAALDAALRRDVPDLPVQTVDVTHSARELKAVQDRIDADMGYWKAHGILIHTLGAYAESGCVEVATLQDDEARKLFPQRYGPRQPIRIVHQQPVSLD